MEQKMKMLENLQDDFDFNYKTLKSQGGKVLILTVKWGIKQLLLVGFRGLSLVKIWVSKKTYCFWCSNELLETELLQPIQLLFHLLRVVPGPEWEQPSSCNQAEDVSARADAECPGPAEEGRPLHPSLVSTWVWFGCIRAEGCVVGLCFSKLWQRWRDCCQQWTLCRRTWQTMSWLTGRGGSRSPASEGHLTSAWTAWRHGNYPFPLGNPFPCTLFTT